MNPSTCAALRAPTTAAGITRGWSIRPAARVIPAQAGIQVRLVVPAQAGVQSPRFPRCSGASRSPATAARKTPACAGARHMAETVARPVRLRYKEGSGNPRAANRAARR
jgi:hypothetical protein